MVQANCEAFSLLSTALMTYRLQTLKELLKEVKSLKSLNYYSLTDSCLEGLCVE